MIIQFDEYSIMYLFCIRWSCSTRFFSGNSDTHLRLTQFLNVYKKTQYQIFIPIFFIRLQKPYHHIQTEWPEFAQNNFIGLENGNDLIKLAKNSKSNSKFEFEGGSPRLTVNGNR